jgi:hypothetical protein
VVRDGKVINEVPLRYAGKKSTFAGQVPLSTAGPIELEVLAIDPANANFGMIRRKVTVNP